MKSILKDAEDELREIIREEKVQDRLAVTSLIVSVLALIVAVSAFFISEQ